MLFSIITPSYNQSSFIEQTILSVLNQGVEFEHIVIDGGSTDGTVEILKKYPHINWISEPDFGQANAINKGIRRAKGQIVAYLCSDDVYLKNCLKTVQDYFEKNLDTTVIYGDCMYIDSENMPNGNMYFTEKYNQQRLFQYDFIPQPSCFWHHQVVENIGLFNENLKYTMDYEYWLRASLNYKFVYLPVTLAAYRLHQDSKTVEQRSAMILETISLLEFFLNSETIPKHLKSALKHGIAKQLLEYSTHLLQINSDPIQAKFQLNKAIMYSTSYSKKIEYLLRFYVRLLGLNGEIIGLTSLYSFLLKLRSKLLWMTMSM
jgi:glycosyltransferase involved in cell wall biosynthesis